MEYVALEQPTYKPAVRVIDAISQAYPASITTSFDHDYPLVGNGPGMLVRIIVPWNFGMTQINKMTGTITVTSPTTFTIDIDSRLFDAFVKPADRVLIPPVGAPVNSQEGFAEVVPVGDVAWRNVL